MLYDCFMGELSDMKQNKSKTRFILGGIFTALCAFLLFQVSFVMTRRIRKVSNPKIYRKNLFAEQVLSLCMLLTSLDIMFNLFTRMKNKFLKAIGWIVRVITYAASAVVLTFSTFIVIGSFMRQRKKAEYAIVLGMALEEGKPTRDLVYRVEMGKKYLDEYPDSKLVLTGGNPNPDEPTEAEVMEKILLKMGVSKDRLILEDKSESTKTNFQNTMEIIGADTPVVLITSNYHLNRAVKIAKKAGFKTVHRLPARSEFFPFAVNVFWEVLHSINEYTGIVKDN